MLYKSLFRPILFQQDPEKVHEHLLSMGRWIQETPSLLALVTQLSGLPNYPMLKQQRWGCAFNTPIGLAAGFDKNIRLSRFFRALGFGFEEAGSISAQPALGNPKPRLFRLPAEQAILNRMGLNNEGVKAILPRIEALPPDWPVGISLVKTHDPAITGESAIEDFKTTLKSVYGYGAYLSLNISCPNTAEGKTFEEPEALERLLQNLREQEAECQADSLPPPRPWLLKISPDLPSAQLQEMFEVACRYGIAGWVATNTTLSRTQRFGQGGLSGQPLFDRSTQILAELWQLKQHHQQPDVVLIGVGGIHNTDSAWQKIIHGATLLQLYTGLIYEGPGLVKTIHNGLYRKLQAHGFQHLEEAVGSALV
jgi:dihydroorotate dehydrogenase